MIAKAVIAAAGRGTRMLHLTKNKPKPLINVCGKPFLSYLLDHILEAGYKELILVGGYKIERVKSFLDKYHYPVSLVNQFEVLGKEKYGTACALKCVEDKVKGEDFLMVYADHIFSPKDLASFRKDDEYNYMGTFRCQTPEKYGAVEMVDGFLKRIVEKPKDCTPGSLVNIGLYKFKPIILKKINEIDLSKRGEYELTDAINLLAREKKVKVEEIKDYWLDFGNPADVMRVSSFIKNENNKVDF